MYVSPITQMIADHGVSARMVADNPTSLPESLVAVALALGVQAYDKTAVRDEAGPSVTETTVDEVVSAIRALMEAGDTKAFGTTGEPKLAALKAKVGKAVTDALRDEAWAIVKGGV